jgi:hypothetical protein
MAHGVDKPSKIEEDIRLYTSRKTLEWARE